MWNNLSIDKLTETDLAGMGTANPVIDWIRGFGVMSEFLSLSPNSRGSVSLDFDFGTVAGRILALMERMQGEFKAAVTGTDRLEVSGGHILMPDDTYSIGGHTRSLRSSDDGNVLSVDVTSQGGVSWSWSNAFPSGSVSGTTLTLPVCQPYKVGTTWQVRQLHLGSYVLAFPPATFIDGYDATKTQSLDHSGGTLVWTTYKRCQQ